jgi:hypothetical protein
MLAKASCTIVRVVNNSPLRALCRTVSERGGGEGDVGCISFSLASLRSTRVGGGALGGGDDTSKGRHGEMFWMVASIDVG